MQNGSSRKGSAFSVYLRRVGRVAECTGLEIQPPTCEVRGFETLTLRSLKQKEVKAMKCTYCGSKTLVTSSIATNKTVIRERQCKECKKRFYTEERVPETVINQYALKRQLYNLRQKRKDELKELNGKE